MMFYSLKNLRKLFKHFSILLPVSLISMELSGLSQENKNNLENSYAQSQEWHQLENRKKDTDFDTKVEDLIQWTPQTINDKNTNHPNKLNHINKFEYIPEKQKVKKNPSKKSNYQAGDIEKDLVIKRKGYVKIQGPKITLTYSNANAKDALLSLVDEGGYGFIFVPNTTKEENNEDKFVTLSFKNEDYEIVINSILLAAGWEGKKEGNILMVGENILNKGFQKEISKIYKMNNASAASAADYLASLGAIISKVKVTDIGQTNESELKNGDSSNSKIISYGSNQGPLKGIIGTTDSRRETITLIGKSDLLKLAESYIKQIDKKQKQVAMSIKIMDVNIDDNKDLTNSFATRLSDPKAYILSDEGNFDLVLGSIDSWKTNRATGVSTLDLSNASKFDFVTWLQAKITSKDTKVLASPTLILSESRDALEGGDTVTAANEGFANSTIGRPFGNESFITVGTKTITSYSVTAGSDGAPASCEPGFETAGLTFGAKLHKVDSQDFISFSLSPEISSVSATQNVGTCGLVNILSKRRLDTGTVRVKSGNTLVLSGVVSDTDTTVTSKWPVVGDMPLLGNLFKSKRKGTQRSELIILVTPKIMPEID